MVYLLCMDMVLTTLKAAQRTDRPVVIMYDAAGGITQRRVYVRKIDGDNLFAYCTAKHSIRQFRLDRILSAVIPEE